MKSPDNNFEWPRRFPPRDEPRPPTPGGFQPPVRLCCGQRHLGPVCPDGWVMCCICFERKQPADLNATANGQKEDVCKTCAEEEKRQAAGREAGG